MSHSGLVIENWENFSDLSVGEILRRTRNQYNLTLEQVEFALRIRASQLEAIEAGDISKLPGRVYAIGFVRSYAEYLGLDGDKIVHLFKNQSVGIKPERELNFPVVATESHTPGAPIVMGGLVCAILIIFGWALFYNPFGQHIEKIPDVPPMEDVAPKALVVTEAVQADPPSEEGLASVRVEAEKPVNRVVIQVIENSWVEIKNANGSAILRRILKPGDEYQVPNETGMVLSTGNAGGLVLSVDGKKIKKLGGSAQVRRNVPLNPEFLLKNIEN